MLYFCFTLVKSSSVRPSSGFSFSCSSMSGLVSSSASLVSKRSFRTICLSSSLESSSRFSLLSSSGFILVYVVVVFLVEKQNYG